ncbi:BlaI/MecI/CopY family transcriptional regulator [Puniceicoccaceae bacterium K14]|nr:BlaI/MecI/CopY family transcriptional regulator [Puniceicoccaceae bacterium K14]
MSKDSLKLSRLEMRVLRAFWKDEAFSIREAHDSIESGKDKPEYTTFQTVVGRLEAKGGLERVRKIGNTWLYRAVISRKSLVSNLVDDIVGLLDGVASPIVSHLLESGKLSKEDLDSLEKLIDSDDDEGSNKSK